MINKRDMSDMNNYDNIQCNECGVSYGITYNNIYGFYNSCKSCGKKMYEEYINNLIEK